MSILLALYMALAVTPQESVIVDIPSLSGPWDNPLSEHPIFSRFVERLESNVEKMDG